MTRLNQSAAGAAGNIAYLASPAAAQSVIQYFGPSVCASLSRHSVCCASGTSLVTPIREVLKLWSDWLLKLENKLNLVKSPLSDAAET